MRKSNIFIGIESDKSHSSSPGIKIGIGCAAGGAFLVAVIAAIILIRKRKAQYQHFDDEGIEIKPLTETSMITQNPLASLMSDDDPFEDEFN